MTVSAAQLAELADAGAPLDEALAGLYATPHVDGRLRLHATDTCWNVARGTVRADFVALTGDAGQLRAFGADLARACPQCQDAARLGAVLEQLESLAAARTDLEAKVTAAETAVRRWGPAPLLTASEALSRARVLTDPALHVDGQPPLLYEPGPLPTGMTAWREHYLAAAHTRTTRALGRYLKVGVAAELLKAAQRDGLTDTAVDPRVDRYVTVRAPRSVLAPGGFAGTAYRTAPRVVREILLTATPIVWMGAGPAKLALYRLPGARAAALLPQREFVGDAGPADPADTEATIAAAAAMCVPGDEPAPLADPVVALAVARDLARPLQGVGTA